MHLSTELPVLAPCEWTGRGLASAIVEQGDERPAVSLDVAQRHEAARRTEDGTAVDVASLLSAKTKLKTLERAARAEGAGWQRLPRAHPRRRQRRRQRRGQDATASAPRSSIETACSCGAPCRRPSTTHCPDTGRAPLIPLMLGGDDLLLVARAEIALPFVVTLCAELDALQKDSNGFKLTLGVGVVFAKHTIPIHRLHEVAEQLASSAKRRFRGLKDGEAKRSVVDWAVFSTAWVDDPEEVRRRDWLRGSGNELRVLSQRPVDVLGETGSTRCKDSCAARSSSRDAPRSQLRYLVDQLSRGRALSELAFAELPQEAKGPLAEAGVKEPWRRARQRVDHCAARPRGDRRDRASALGHATPEAQLTTERGGRPCPEATWVRQTLTAELLSDAHLGSGSGGGGIDALVARDRHDRPVIWASHVEGVLRDAARRLRGDEEAEAFFGRAGGEQQRAVFTSLYAKDRPREPHLALDGARGLRQPRAEGRHAAGHRVRAEGHEARRRGRAARERAATR